MPPSFNPVWGFWMDGAFYFGTPVFAQGAQLGAKSAVSVHLDSGDDVSSWKGP